MILYVRDRSKFVVFFSSLEEFKEFEDSYVGQEVVIGDLSYFSRALRQRLLKFLESNPQVDCYASYDLSDPILMSRFAETKKVQLEHKPNELGDVVNYYTVFNGTTIPAEQQLYFVNTPEFRNLILAVCQLE